MPDERNLSDRLVDELSGIVRKRQASLAIRVQDYCQSTWHVMPGEEPGNRITPDQIHELVTLVIESFENIAGEIQGAVEIDAALFTRGMDALRQAEIEDGEE